MISAASRLLPRGWCRPPSSASFTSRRSYYSYPSLICRRGLNHRSSSTIRIDAAITRVRGSPYHRDRSCNRHLQNNVCWLSTASSSDNNDDSATPPIEVTVTNSSNSTESPDTGDDNKPNLPKSSGQLAEEEILSLQSELRTHHRHAAYDTALQTATKLLELTISHFGNLHPSTASAHNNVGLMMKCLGRYGEAKESYHESLRIYGEVCGKDHASYAAALSNLGMLERGRVLESESATDNEDDTTNSEINNLPNEDGIDLEELREKNTPHNEKLSAMERMQLNESSIEYFDEAYRIRLSELGPNHPHTITSQSQLGSAMAAAVIAERRGRIGGLIESELRQLKQAKNVKDAKEMEAYVPEAIKRAASKTSLSGGLGSKLTRRRWEAAEQHLRGALRNAVDNPRGESVGPLMYISIGDTSKNTGGGIKDDESRRGLTLPPKKKDDGKLSKKEKKRLEKERLREHRRANSNALHGGSKNGSSEGTDKVAVQGVAAKVTTLSAATAAQNLAVFLKNYSDWMRLSLMDESNDNNNPQQAEPQLSQQQIQSIKLLNQTIQEARHLYESALHVRSSILPPHHPEVVASKFSLAELLDSPKVSESSAMTLNDATSDTDVEVVDSERANQLREEILSAYNVEEK